MTLGLVMACDPSKVDESYWDRTPIAASPDGGFVDGETDTPATAAPQEPGPCSVAVTVTTVSYDGEFAPKNVGAVWITREDGRFVRTLEVWGRKRIEHAVAWIAATDGNDVDAVTGATRKRHGTHSLEWNCRDADGAEAAPGRYVLNVEFSEDNSAEGEPEGPVRAVDFETVAGSSEVVVPDDANFEGITIRLAP